MRRGPRSCAPYRPSGPRPEAYFPKWAIWVGLSGYREAVGRKIALVAGVGVAWLVTFVVMGGTAVPSIDFNASTPVSDTSAQGGPVQNAAPLTPAASPTTAAPSDTPGSLAGDVESVAGGVPLTGATLAPKPAPRRAAAVIYEFRMASFNVLGSSHTAGSKKRGPGVTRMSAMTDYLLAKKFSVVGFQEMQRDQRNRFLAKTGGNWGLYPHTSPRSIDGENAIGWDKDVWELVKADTISVPYFGGAPRNNPVLRLKHKASGASIYISNYHNAADVMGKAQRWRDAATRIQVNLFKELAKTGLPVFATGDMNERRAWACEVVTGADMRTSFGGDGRNGCSVTHNGDIDWIVGSHDVTFFNNVSERSAFLKSVTDHPVVYTDVRIDSRDFPKSVG